MEAAGGHPVAANAVRRCGPDLIPRLLEDFERAGRRDRLESGNSVRLQTICIHSEHHCAVQISAVDRGAQSLQGADDLR